MKAHEHIAVVKPRSQLTTVKSPVLRTVKLHVEVFASRFSVFIELSGSKINGAYTRNNSAFSYALRTEMIADFKHHSWLDSLFELRQVLDGRNIGLFCFGNNHRLFGCDLSNRLRLHRFRLFLFGFSIADILIESAVQEFIIRDILRSSVAAFICCDRTLVRIER